VMCYRVGIRMGCRRWRHCLWPTARRSIRTSAQPEP
jgi:hypothetical protein